MKKLVCLLVLVLCFVGLDSCKEDDNNKIVNSSQDIFTLLVGGRWTVTDVNSAGWGNWIEFTSRSTVVYFNYEYGESDDFIYTLYGFDLTFTLLPLLDYEPQDRLYFTIVSVSDSELILRDEDGRYVYHR
jgi:hypothetical protein